MSDHPMLFSAPMIRALLDGRKTQTRRVLNLPIKGEYFRKDMGGWAATTVGGGGCFTIGRGGERIPAPEKVAIWNQTTGTCIVTRWQPGDRLWVREGFRVNGWATDVATIFYRANERDSYTEMCEQFPIAGKKFIAPTPGKWRPGIHLPHWASRLTLTVTDVRVQQLQEISDQDVLAEGVLANPVRGHFNCAGGYVMPSPSQIEYAELWDEINGEGSWDENPWVAALTFTVVRRNIDEASSQR